MTIQLDTMAIFSIEHGLRVADPKQMLDWYCDVVGFEPHAEIFVPGGHVWALRFGNSILKMLHYPDLQVAEGDERLSCHYMTVHVLNAEEMQQRCAGAGSTVLVPYSTFTPARPGDPACGYAIVQDPEGNSVEFSQGSPWVAPTGSFRDGVPS